MKPKVSIIIPSYNAAGYINEAIDSVLAQTYPSVEIIVIDDGSTDGTKKILEQYIASKQIKYFFQENKGLSGARNTGIRNASGEIMALLDADDTFLPQKIEKQVDFFSKNPDCGVCYSGAYHFWDGEPAKLFKLNYIYYSGDKVLPNLIKKDFIAPTTIAIRKAVFEKFGLFDESLRRSEDLDFLFRILIGGAKICFLDESLVKLRLRRNDNLQGFQSQPEVQKTVLFVLERVRDKLDPTEIKKLQLRKYLALRHLKIGLVYLENEDKRSAREFILKAFDDFPAGRLLGLILWLPVFIVPTPLLSQWTRYFHLRRQKNNLIPLQ